MAMVQPKSQKLRLFITHVGLLVFIAAIMFPLLMVITISLREGNFATGSLIPEHISPGALETGIRFQRRARRRSRHATTFPGTVVAVELGKNCWHHRAGYCGAFHHLRLRLRPNAFSGESNTAERNVDFPDVPGSAFAGGIVCIV